MKKEAIISNIKWIIIVIIIILVLVGLAFFVKKNFEDEKLQNLSTNMLQIQAKTKILTEKNKLEEQNELKGTNITEEDVKKLNIENNENIKKLSQSDLEYMGLNEIKEDNKFIVDYENNEVYYIDGYENDDGNIYYSLSEINNIAMDDTKEE